jgi:hypothetical protein
MKTYYLTTKPKILSLIAPIVILAFFFGINQDNLVCFGSISVLFALLTISNIISEHVTLSKDGIKYHRVGLTFNTEWKNVRELKTRWVPPFEQEGIILTADQFRIAEWWVNSNELGVWGQKAFIPLSKFSDNWRDSELGQQIKQYAPHLFERENKQSA